MQNLSRLEIELNNKKYFDKNDEALCLYLEENDLDPYEEYNKDTDKVKLLHTVYCIMQALSNNIDAFRKVETEFATTSAAYQYLQGRLDDLRDEIDRLTAEQNGNDSAIRYMFYNN